MCASTALNFPSCYRAHVFVSPDLLEGSDLGHVLGLPLVVSLLNGLPQGLDMLERALRGQLVFLDVVSVKSAWVPSWVMFSLSPAAIGLLGMLAISMTAVDVIGLS
jgi:hypothetical protein